MYLERLRWNGDSGLASEVRLFGSFRQTQVEDVQERREDEEELGFGQHVAQADPPSDAERDEVIGFDDGRPVGAQKPIRIEQFRIFPQRRVHVDGVNQRDHLRPFRYRHTVQSRRSII